jgi:sugar lactone lactonase YvrE
MMHRFSQRHICYVLGVVLAMAVPLCTAASPSRSTRNGWMARNANPNHAWLYVGSDLNNVVTAYDLQSPDNQLVEKITSGISRPGGIALDAAGTLYVPNENAATVTVYSAGSTEPNLTLTGTDSPEGVVVDSEDNVYVCNRGANPGISIYLAGQSTPAQHITSSLLQSPSQVALDSAGTLYISDNNTGLSFLLAGSQTVTHLDLQGLPRIPSGLAVDSSTGNIYLSSAIQPPDFLKVYFAGQEHPGRTRKLPYGGLDFLAIGMFHKKGVLFVPDSQGDVVYGLNLDLTGAPYIVETVSHYVATSVAFKAAGVP